MEMTTWQPDIERDALATRWCADISGPWYDDSNPQGEGNTEEEAKKNALVVLKEVYEEIGEFLKEHGMEVR